MVISFTATYFTKHIFTVVFNWKDVLPKLFLKLDTGVHSSEDNGFLHYHFNSNDSTMGGSLMSSSCELNWVITPKILFR